jgi:hypothetical protein
MSDHLGLHHSQIGVIETQPLWPIYKIERIGDRRITRTTLAGPMGLTSNFTDEISKFISYFRNNFLNPTKLKGKRKSHGVRCSLGGVSHHQECRPLTPPFVLWCSLVFKRVSRFDLPEIRLVRNRWTCYRCTNKQTVGVGAVCADKCGRSKSQPSGPTGVIRAWHKRRSGAPIEMTGQSGAESLRLRLV